MNDDATIVVTLGPCDDMRAELFVRPSAGRSHGGRLVGAVTGPRRRRDATLPTTARLVPLPDREGAGAVSRAILTEPAFWTPELPNRYRVEARLEPGAARGVADSWIGLRRLGVRGRSFWLDGRRWVPRAVGGDVDPAAARAAAVGLVVESPCDELLARTDEEGVAVVAVLQAADATPRRIEALSQHPSALLAILAEGEVKADTAARLSGAKGTLQLGLAFDGGESPPRGIPEGIDFLVIRLAAEGLPHDDWRVPPARPLVAWRPGLEGSRASCEALQRELAHWGLAASGDRPPWDWAGYLVGSGFRREAPA